MMKGENISEDIKEAMDKLKKKVEEGNVDRVQIKKGNEVVFSVPVNVGIVVSKLSVYGLEENFFNVKQRRSWCS